VAICRDCGQPLRSIPISYGAPAPAYYLALPRDQQSKRAELTSDQCVIDGEHFFVRGSLRIPVAGRDEPFEWGVWTSLSKPNILRMTDLWQTLGRESEPPYFGWLSSELIQVYGKSTINLKTHVLTQPVGLRPLIELEHTDHPLAIEQHHGITWQRVEEIASILHHADNLPQD
jgi:hypothetical protein